jgi:hypothetical protein
MLGNQKPSALRQVEWAIWRLVMRVSNGSTAEDEVEEFLREFQSMLEIWERDDPASRDYSFFSTCKSSSANINFPITYWISLAATPESEAGAPALPAPSSPTPPPCATTIQQPVLTPINAASPCEEVPVTPAPLTSKTPLTPLDVLMQGPEEILPIGAEDIMMTSDAEMLPSVPSLLPAAVITDKAGDVDCDSVSMFPVDTEEFIESVLDTARLAAATEGTPPQGLTPHGTPSAQRILDPDGFSPSRIERMFETALGSRHSSEGFMPVGMGDMAMGEGVPALWDHAVSTNADNESGNEADGE